MRIARASFVLAALVSSLVHVLIVTPVIFFWLHERQIMRRATEEAAGRELPAAELERES